MRGKQMKTCAISNKLNKKKEHVPCIFQNPKYKKTYHRNQGLEGM